VPRLLGGAWGQLHVRRHEEAGMNTEKLIDRLNDLIQLDVDAVHAYDEAISACEIPFVKQQLTDFRGDHERHVDDLSAEVSRLGGEPKIKRDVKGFLIKGFTAVLSHGDHSALLAMRGNEELTNKTYESAANETLPPPILAIVQRNWADEKRHLAWIKDAIDKKLWEQAA
jgi:uncharacterized protein (TIGR02284 family)